MEGVTVFSGKSGIIQKTEKLVIKDFLDVMTAYPPGKSVESDPFMAGDTPLSILVFLNGDSDDNRGHVSIFLYNKSNQDINVKCKFITDVKTEELNYEDTVEANDYFGFPDLLTHAECEEAYKDKDFVVTAKVEISGEMVKIVGSSSASAPKKRKFNVMENVYKKMDRSDFKLVFDGEEVTNDSFLSKTLLILFIMKIISGALPQAHLGCRLTSFCSDGGEQAQGGH